MKYKIIAKSGKGNGILPMKQGGNQEAKKSEKQKTEELCNFVKNAFCADGEAILVHSEKPLCSREFFIVEDSKRGTFGVIIKNIN